MLNICFWEKNEEGYKYKANQEPIQNVNLFDKGFPRRYVLSGWGEWRNCQWLKSLVRWECPFFLWHAGLYLSFRYIKKPSASFVCGPFNWLKKYVTWLLFITSVSQWSRDSLPTVEVIAAMRMPYFVLYWVVLVSLPCIGKASTSFVWSAFQLAEKKSLIVTWLLVTTATSQWPRADLKAVLVSDREEGFMNLNEIWLGVITTPLDLVMIHAWTSQDIRWIVHDAFLES